MMDKLKSLLRVPLVAEGFWVVIALVGIVSGIFLTKQVQNASNKAFSGYSATTGTGTNNISSAQIYASPNDIPQNDALISDKTTQGLFYTYAKRYQNAKPEYQAITIPYLNVSGKVFLYYDKNTDTSYLFSRLENMQPLPKKFLILWVNSNTEDQDFHLATSQFVNENNKAVAYQVYVGRGNIKNFGNKIIYSYDDSVTQRQPGSIILTVNF